MIPINDKKNYVGKKKDLLFKIDIFSCLLSVDL